MEINFLRKIKKNVLVFSLYFFLERDIKQKKTFIYGSLKDTKISFTSDLLQNRKRALQNIISAT